MAAAGRPLVSRIRRPLALPKRNGDLPAAVLLPLMIEGLIMGDLPRAYLISIPLFGQIHFLTSPPWISAFAWMVFTPKMVSAL